MKLHASASHAKIVRYDAGGVEDAARVQRVSVAPGSVLIRHGPDGAAIVAVGRPGEVDRHEAAAATQERVSLPDSVLIPAPVNAHTHLDLTHIGPRPHNPADGFLAFIGMVRPNRHTDPPLIAESVRRGVELSLAGGTAAVGDIAGAAGGSACAAAYHELARSGLSGVSYLEFFAIGRGEDEQRRRVERVVEDAPMARIRLGLQPHAPYSVSPGSYRWAMELARRRSLPICTHVGESPEEREFVARARGPLRSLLERLGVWDDAILGGIGRGRSPVAHLTDALAEASDGSRTPPMLAVHVNDASDGDIEALARVGASVVYCPRASAYFGAERHFGPHRYRDMLGAGIPVALGTDSIINLPDSASDAARGGISVLDEMRMLFGRDGTDPRVLLAMATTHGASALGLDPERFALGPGSISAGILAIDVSRTDPSRPTLERVMRSVGAPRWIAGAGAAAGA